MENVHDVRAVSITVVILGLAALGLAILVRAVEARLAFFPTRGEQTTPRSRRIPYESLDVTTADGVRLRAWWMPQPAPRATIAYFHGNGGNLSAWLDVLASIHARGYAILAFDYRGYGASTGEPGERELYQDVDAILATTGERVRVERPLVYWGRSLGTVMAAYAARRTAGTDASAPAAGENVPRPDGVILEAGFPDLATLLRGNLVLSLLRPLSSYVFPTTRHMANVRVPALVIHGDHDSVIPFANGEALFAQLGTPRKRFVRVAGGDHNDVVPPNAAAYWQAIDEFIDELRE